MMTPLFEIYQTVFNRIQEIEPGKYWIDIDMGQLDSDGCNVPITFPAVLLRFEDVIWKDREKDYQIGLVNLSVKYAHRFQSENEMLNGTQPRQEIQNCLENLQIIHEKLNKVRGETFSELTRFNQYHRKTNANDLLWVNVF